MSVGKANAPKAKIALSVAAVAVFLCVTVAVCFLTAPMRRPSSDPTETTETMETTDTDSTSGEDPEGSAEAPPADPVVLEWFTDAFAEASIELPDFPGVTFVYTANAVPDKIYKDYSIYAVKNDTPTLLVAGLPVQNAYFTDLNGDGSPELCTTVSIGSGIIDRRIAVYDYANGNFYEYSERMIHDYELTLADGKLTVLQKNCMEREKILASGTLALEKDNSGGLSLTVRLYD